VSATQDVEIAQDPAAEPARTFAQVAFSIGTRVLVSALLVTIVVWAFAGIQFDFTNLHQGLISGRHYMAQMFPHNIAELQYASRVLIGNWPYLVQTIQIAIVGTVVGAIPALPLCFLAARTTSLFRPLAVVVKTALNIGRSVPILIYALLTVCIIGLGAPAGAIALAFGSFVMLTKLYAEALESVSPGPVEAVRAVGGSPAQVFVFGMLPQVFPNFISATLYALELNMLSSFVLGFVGAGGIGFNLQNYLRLYQMLDAGVLVFLLIILVNIVDYLSYRIRMLFA
jgi:phosphonate transport system permease protein